ncbi:MAG: hypothetical protein R6W94_13805, partial [Spirochaetia bacterium]
LASSPEIPMGNMHVSAPLERGEPARATSLDDAGRPFGAKRDRNQSGDQSWHVLPIPSARGAQGAWGALKIV